ncbi:MAG: hypothetical protein JXA18_11840 [Chitinispirillaceae bacterium]|nr:hypothetical protein [Chitinispirillaceae bacterium]
MVNENDTILIQELTDSYRSQLVRYCGLRDVTRQLMAKLVLTRGDVSLVKEHLRKKQQLLEAIERERSRVTEQVAEWQRRKESIGRGTETDLFNEVLKEVTDAIRAFLDDEAQLRKYLESVAAQAASPRPRRVG